MADRSWINVFIPTHLIFRYHLPLKQISQVISHFPMQRKNFDELWLKIRPLCPGGGRKRTYTSTLFCGHFHSNVCKSTPTSWTGKGTVWNTTIFAVGGIGSGPPPSRPPPPPTPSANTAIMASSSLSSSQAFRSRIHDRTNSLRFLGIILRVLRIEISQTIGKGVWFSIRFSSFLLSSVQ